MNIFTRRELAVTQDIDHLNRVIARLESQGIAYEVRTANTRRNIP